MKVGRGKSRLNLKGNFLMGWVLLGNVSYCPSASWQRTDPVELVSCWLLEVEALGKN